MGRKLPVFLRGAELPALVQGALAGRDQLLCLVGLYAGLRVSELVALKVEDLDLVERTLFVDQGKGAKDRYVPIPERLVDPLRLWIGRRPTGWLFPSPRRHSKSGHLSARTVERMVLGAAARAGLTKHVTPHKLRHTYATRLLATGANLREVQDLLGHASIATTEIYTHTEVDRLRGAVDRL